ncbi:bifunctional diguanylate cyclase/phosphodiesterase [Marinicella litoralis]|nr:EAL domain-containing protein [Marinicella litoralis]
MLNKDEALFRLTGERLLELGLFSNNPESITLLDNLLDHNQALVGMTVANPQGDIILSSSNIDKEEFSNLLEQEETQLSFIQAMNSDALVMGRTYFSTEYNDWIVPINYRILNKNKEVVAVLSNGIKVKGNHSPWQNNNEDSALRVSVMDSNYYFQFASFVEADGLEALYSQPVKDIYLTMFSDSLFQQTGYTLKEFMTKNHGTVVMEYLNHTGELLIGAFSYDLKYGHFIFTTHKKSALTYKLMIPFVWLSSLILAFNIVLFYLFRNFSRLQRNSKADLEFQSQQDQLTSLPNLRYLSRHFAQWKKQNGEQYSVIFIDLDNFKNSNDIHGHPVGDQILIEVARRLKLFFKMGLCVRQGGDEFIVITPYSNKDSTIELCNDFLLTLKQPIKVEELEFSIRASIGIAHSPVDGEADETLLRKADIAMYEAKRLKCGVYVFNQQLDKKNARSAMIGKELNHALEKGEFSLVYQPQIDVVSKNVIGVEVLLRWHNEILHQVSPYEFIPIAESTGAILDIGNFVFEKAFEEFEDICNEIVKNNKKYTQANPFRLSINVSILQLSNENFLSNLFDLINKYDCENAKLMLEITETLIIENPRKIGTILEKIRQSGIEVSLDDFGTGYSSLSYLTKLPINELKIDQSFIHGLTTKKTNLTLVKSIINLGNSLGIKVLAEGVETNEELMILKNLKCQFIQGYYFSKPLNKTNLMNFLKEH